MYESVKAKIKNKLKSVSEGSDRLMGLLDCSVGRLCMKSVKTGKNWEAEIGDNELNLAVGWLKASIAGKAGWLADNDSRGRPKKLMNFLNFPEMFKVINVDLVKSIKNAARKCAVVPLVLAGSVVINPSLVVAQNLDNGILKMASWELRGSGPFEFLKHNGNGDDQFSVGQLYLYGEDVVADLEVAADWFERAAIQGHDAAQFNLARMYFIGQGVVPDDEKAIYWLKKSAKSGNPYAQDNLGSMYHLGIGVGQDAISAHMWKKIATHNASDAGFGIRDDGRMSDILSKMTSDDIEIAEVSADLCLDSGYKKCTP